MSPEPYLSCAVERVIVTSVGFLDLASGEITVTEERTETRPCGTPLFYARDRARGVCRACAKLWEAEGSRITDAGLDFIIERTTSPGVLP